MYVFLHVCMVKGLGLTQILQNGDASYTYGCLEPTMLTQMAKYLDTVYISGWQSSSTASSSDEPGPDLADYPYVRLRFPDSISAC
jgi:isocitrate lyase